MSQTPPYEPNPDHTPSNARQHVEELHQVTQAILAQSANPNLPGLSQLILRRGLLVDAVRSMDFQSCPPEEKEALLQLLLECKQLDQAIAQNMQSFRGALDEQIRGLKDAKALIHKYQIPPSGEIGTRSRDA